MDEKFVINIGRQLGSGGREIGEKLATRLGISFYDKELINLASEESGLCREFFEKADERAAQGIVGGLFGARFPFIGDGAIPTMNCLSNDALFKVQSDVIRKLAEEKSCLFVGRCADYILRDHPRCANVFISASREERIARLCRIHSISKNEAKTVHPSATMAMMTARSVTRRGVMGCDIFQMRATPTIATRMVQTEEISSKEWPRALPTISSARRAQTIATEAGSERTRTLARKFPRTSSWFGSRARTNDGMPMIAVERSDIWIGMK